MNGVVTSPNARPGGAVVYLVPQVDTVAPAPESVVIDQANLRFVPRVAAVTPGTTIAFRNSDPIMHNVFSPAETGDPFDLGTYPRSDHRSHTFTRPGAYVILCHVHPEMAAYVVVVPTAHRAVVDERGRFRIVDVPRGRYLLRVWHRRAPLHEEPLEVLDGGVYRLEIDLGASRRNQ